jgi:hypothetical protein
MEKKAAIIYAFGLQIRWVSNVWLRRFRALRPVFHLEALLEFLSDNNSAKEPRRRRECASALRETRVPLSVLHARCRHPS